MKKNIQKLAAMAAVGLMVVPSADASTVQLNGQPLNTSVAPLQYRGRTLVPMRDIFEALGAKVNWNSFTQAISATRGSTTVQMQMGRSTATLNGQMVRLDQPPLIVNGRTMVPLRFVSEAMGANVSWDGRLQLVSINTGGPLPGGGTSVASQRTITVPAGVLVPVTLDDAISSASARAGDRFTATVKSQRIGDSEFPAGSKIEGVVTEARAKNGKEPGLLDLSFKNVVLPDGSRYAINGSLSSLDEANVTTSGDGRLIAKNTGGGNKLKVIGIGAGVGYVIGKVLLKKDGILSAVLGAAGGYLYDSQKNKNRAAEAVVPTGASLGVKLNSPVAYRDTTGYSTSREQVLGTRLQ